MTAPPTPPGSGRVIDLVTLLNQMSGTPPEPEAAPGPGPTTADPAPGPDDEPAAADSAESPDRPVYRDLDAWVSRHLARVVERRLAVGAAAGAHWCPQWWRHPEAISRLYALWRAWETLRDDPDTGLSVWWRDHFEHHWTALTGEYGPFSRCGPDRGHTPTQWLPAEPAPPEVLAVLPDSK